MALLAVWLLLIFAAAAEAKAEVMQKDQFGVERRGFQAPDRFRVPGSVSPVSAGSGGGGGDGVILLSVVAVVGKEKQGRRLADTKFYWCDANETAEALRAAGGQGTGHKCQHQVLAQSIILRRGFCPGGVPGHSEASGVMATEGHRAPRVLRCGPSSLQQNRT